MLLPVNRLWQNPNSNTGISYIILFIMIIQVLGVWRPLLKEPAITKDLRDADVPLRSTLLHGSFSEHFCLKRTCETPYPTTVTVRLMGFVQSLRHQTHLWSQCPCPNPNHRFGFDFRNPWWNSEPFARLDDPWHKKSEYTRGYATVNTPMSRNQVKENVETKGRDRQLKELEASLKCILIPTPFSQVFWG